MPDKIKVNYLGQEVEATVVEVTQASEVWNHYLIDDGSVIKIKLVLTKVLRLEGKFDDEGNPVYLVRSTNVVSVKSPDNLRRHIA